MDNFREAFIKKGEELLASDKEKLIDWINNFTIPPAPKFDHFETKETHRIGVEYIDLILHGMLREIDKL